MKVLQRIVALCLALLLAIPPLDAGAAEGAPVDGAYYRLKETWKGAYLYEDADGKARYGYPAIDDASAQWAIETTEDGDKRLRNRATGHYLNGQSVTDAEITKPLDVSATESGWTSDRWNLVDVAGKPGEYTIARADRPTWVANVQIQDGYVQGNNWAQPGWGSSSWKLEPAETIAPVRIVLPWKGTYLYEDGGKAKYGTPAANDPASQWFVEEKNGHKTFRNRATGHYLNAQSVTPEAITAALDSSAIGDGWTSDQWDIAPAPGGADGINIVNSDHPNWIVNAQNQDGFAQSNDWAQKSWGSAVWKLEIAADTTPVRIMDEWKGDFLYEEGGLVKSGQPDWQDKASHWIAEDAASGVRLRNLATGNYASSVDYAGGAPLATVALPGIDATWKREAAKDGNGGAVDGFVTLQSMSPGHDNAVINVQAQDGFAHGNNWAQKPWGSAHWKLAAPAAPSTGPVEPTDPYIRIKNNWLQLYLYESDGVVKYGNVKAGDPNFEWLIETAGGAKRIKNRATGHYVSLDGVEGARDALAATELPEGSAIGDWIIEDYQGFKEIRSAGDDSGSYINVENKLKYAQYGVVPREWGSPKWEFVATATPAVYYRLKNDYFGAYLYESTEGATVNQVVYGYPAADDTASHWSLEPSTKGTLIVNRATGHLMNVEQTASHEDPVMSLALDRTWGSAQWHIEDAPAPNADKKVIRNDWKDAWIVHLQDQKGFAQASDLPRDWGSGHWVLEPAPEVAPALPTGFIRISNRATGQYLYENGSNVVLYGTPAANDASSHWIIANEGGVQLIVNRATGHAMSIGHPASYLETTDNPAADDVRAEWAIESGSAKDVYLIRSLADGNDDAYVHLEDGQGYAQVELRSVESGKVQWLFEEAPAEAVAVPPEEGPRNAVTPVQDELNFVRIRDGGTSADLALSEGDNGAVTFGAAGAGDERAQWLPQDYNGHKRFVNRATGHYLALDGGAASAIADGSGLAAQWNVWREAGYVVLGNAEEDGGELTAASGNRLRLENVLGDARYEAEQAFVYGDATASPARGFATGFGAEGAGVLFSVNAEQDGTYDAALRARFEGAGTRRLDLYVNGLKQPATVAFSSGGSGWAETTLRLPLRAGMNTVSLQAGAANAGAGVDIDALTVRGAANKAYRGATLPFTTYEAEDADTNGTEIGPDREYKTFASEASGRRAVTLDATGEYVGFKTAKAANALAVRYIVPDAAAGGGQDATLSLYVDGESRGKLRLTSRYSWVYGKYPWSNDPAEGDAHRFYDETHALIGDVPAGATVELRKESGDAADYYVIDLVELEQAADPYPKPDGYVSVTDYGATADDASDDTGAFVSAIAAAKRSGKGVWVPAGRFELREPLRVDHVTIRGAGMWHTTLHGAGFLVGGSGFRAYDFLLDVGVTARHDELREAGFDGTFGYGSVIQNVWIEHAKAGIWSMRSESGASTNGLYVGGVRIRDTYADGINFSTGTSHSMIEQTHIRNSGDDGIALWSQKMDGVAEADASTKGNVVRFNTIELPWLADNVAIFGGRDNKVQDNVVSDTVGFGAGIAVSTRFDPVAFAGRTTVERNTLVRTGGREPSWGQNFGAIWLFTGDKPINADIVIRGNAAYDSTYQGLYISGPNAIADNGTHRVLLQNNVIDGTGTWGVHVNGDGVSGSADVDRLLVRGAKVGLGFNASSSFSLREVEPQQVAADGDFVSDAEPTVPTPPTSTPTVVLPGGPSADLDARLLDALSGTGDVVLQLGSEGGATFSFAALREAASKRPGRAIVLQSGKLSYSLPADILAWLADEYASLDLEGEGKLTVTMSPVAGDTLAAMRERAQASGFSLTGAPVSFELTLDTGGSAAKIESFGKHFVTRAFAVEGDIDPRHASVVVYDPVTGQFRTVPALFETKDGIAIATARSATNSIYAVAIADRTFADISNHWAKDDIALMASKQLVQGDSADVFAPDRGVTRAEFAALLVRALGLSPTADGASKFADVKANAWYAASVATAARFGLVTGGTDGAFRPEARITREEMAVMLSRALALSTGRSATASSGVEKRFGSDAARISEWARGAVAEVAERGLMQGRSPNAFAPRAETTRAEAAVVLKRLLQSVGFMN